MVGGFVFGELLVREGRGLGGIGGCGAEGGFCEVDMYGWARVHDDDHATTDTWRKPHGLENH